MKDKFEIFMTLMYLEANTNHFGIYITIGQFGRILRQVDQIYNSWDDNLTLKDNINKYFKRSISPMGDAGKNKL